MQLPDINSVLALDLATQFGWAIWRKRDLGDAGSVEFGSVLLPSTGSDLGALLQHYHTWLSVKIASRGVEVVVYESAYMARDPTVFRRLACLGGVTELVCAQLSVPFCYEEKASSVFKHFVGRKGKIERAEKKRLTVQKCHSFGWSVENDDQADALALLDFMIHILKRKGRLNCEPNLKSEYIAPTI